MCWHQLCYVFIWLLSFKLPQITSKLPLLCSARSLSTITDRWHHGNLFNLACFRTKSFILVLRYVWRNSFMLMSLHWWLNLLEIWKPCWIALWLHLRRLIKLSTSSQDQLPQGTPLKDIDPCFDGKLVKTVSSFIYIYVIFRQFFSLGEIIRRIQSAANASGDLKTRVWSQREPATKCNCFVYLFYHLPFLNYSTEIYAMDTAEEVNFCSVLTPKKHYSEMPVFRF